MAAEVLRLDPGGVDGDCETSGTDINSAANGCTQDGCESTQDADVPAAKKSKVQQHNHHRRKPSKKKRKWKPYSKMTWEEKKAVQEREEIRADRIRGEMMNRGRPVAPYNTTQFIMAEHDPYEEDDDIDKMNPTNNDASSSKSSTSGTYSAQLNIVDSPQNNDEFAEPNYTDSPHMAPEFISQDFSEAYERVQEESLATMSRSGLVKEHLSLEKTLSYLQDKLAEVKNVNNAYSIKMHGIEKQLEKLRSENKRLARENMCLKYGEEHVKEQEEKLILEFQTSDYEYEAPNDDQDPSYEDSVEGGMDVGDCFGISYAKNKTNGLSEDMLVSSLEQKPCAGSVEEEKYYADNTSEEFESRSNMRRKRKSQKTRDLEMKSRDLDVDCCDDAESSDDQTYVDNNKQTDRKVTVNQNNNNNNKPTEEKLQDKYPDKASLETMDIASYSSEKGGLTASMESVTE